jgi:Motility quorum-sensing regulator, toxin of MqsA
MGVIDRSNFLLHRMSHHLNACLNTQLIAAKIPKIHKYITIMVTFNVISEYSLTSPNNGGGEKIVSGPLYDLERVKTIAKHNGGLQLWTKDCVKDVRELGWDADDVARLIQRLTNAHYIDSQWCENGKNAWAACDAYSVTVKEWIPTARKDMWIGYFCEVCHQQAW